MILGLDIGSNSVGWCLIGTDGDGAPNEIVAAGVRCFAAGVVGDLASGREESRTVKRRGARLIRRQGWRRQRRKQKLFRLLQSLNLLPPTQGRDPTSIHRCIHDLDASIRASDPECSSHRGQQVLPYRLRWRAARERLAPYEVGRAFYHLAQRRGFLSNRKQTATGDDDPGQVEDGIRHLSAAIRDSGQQTLGSYLSTLDPEQERIRARWTSRKMYEDEFEAIWNEQSKHHTVLDDEARRSVHRAIFDQRPLRDQSNLIGRCEFEPDERRCRIAHPVFQLFRLLQTVNNLRVDSPGEPSRSLRSDERALLIDRLSRTAELKKQEAKKLLGISAKARFSIEEGGEAKIIGDRTGASLRTVFGDRWDALSPEKSLSAIEDVLVFEKEAALRARAERHWGLTPEAAEKMAKLRLEEGHAGLSIKALSRLTPHLQAGLSYSEAVKLEYPDAFKAKAAIDRLPAVRSADGFPELRNPVVLRALSEVRKVVNGIVRNFGKPEIVRIELARDLKRGRQERRKLSARMREQEGLRKDAADRIAREAHIANSPRRDIEKVMLANECGWRCPYTGRSISMRDLVGDSPSFEVEHIIPFSRSLDDSFFNKTLCWHEENRNTKRNRTPLEAYGTSMRWDEILGRVRGFQGKAASEKLRRFLIEDVGEELSDEFTERHLNDTRYASKLAAEYLGRLYGGTCDENGRRRVQVTSGRLTAFLRGRWELNKLLDDGGEKTRNDHRHHAVDALVVGLTSPGAVKQLADAAREADRLGGRRLFAEIRAPWEGVLEEARSAIGRVVVSHRVDRRLNGALHDETIYGKQRNAAAPRGGVRQVRHVRKPLASLARGDIEEIVDAGIRERVRAQLAQLCAADPKLSEPQKAFADAGNHPVIDTASGRRVPIHRVRIRKTQNSVCIGSGPSLRHVAPGSNHHMAIVAVLDGQGAVNRWESHIVTRLEAMDRQRKGEAVIARDWGANHRFVFSLRSGDSVQLDVGNGERAVCVVRAISGKRVEVTRASDARTQTDVRKAGKAGGRLILGCEALRSAGCEKVNVDPMGVVAVAHD